MAALIIAISRKIQAVEIGKNNRIEQTPIHNLNLPANPHGYWLFGSLDFQSGNMISSQSRYDRFDTSAYLVFIAPPRTAFGKMRDFDA